MFVLQNTPKSDLKLPELGWRFMGPEHFTAKFDLTLFMTDRPQGLSGSLEYNTDLFNQSTVARMAAYFQALLEGIVREPDERVGNISVSVGDGG
jgi:non-ribosomal peptide synthetase component F